MRLRVKWIENVAFVGETESSHAIVMDGAAEGGGRNLGPRPMETVLAGTGGCTAYDVVTILKKARQDISDKIAEEKRRGETQKYLEKLRDAATITWHNDELKKAYEQALAERRKQLDAEQGVPAKN